MISIENGLLIDKTWSDTCEIQRCFADTNMFCNDIFKQLTSYYNQLNPNFNSFVNDSVVAKDLTLTQSIFLNHQLKIDTLQIIPILIENKTWITSIIVLALLLLALLQTVFRKRLMQIFRSVVQPNFLNQLIREGNLLIETIEIPLKIIFFTITPLFIIQFLNVFDIVGVDVYSLKYTAIVMGILILYSLMESGVLLLTGSIFHTKPETQQNMLLIAVYNNFTGIILIPIVILMFIWESKIIAIIGGAIIAILFIIRCLRIVSNGIINSKYHYFYLFLYLCTLEIFPILVLLTIVKTLV